MATASSGVGQPSPDGSPQGSPPVSPSGAPALDGADLARRMLEAAETAARAAASTASAVELFRQQADAAGGNSKSTDWFKLLPKPGAFEPKDYDQEVAMWREWWWTVNQYLCTLDNKYEAEVKYIETHTSVYQDPGLMNEEEKKRSMFLYGLLASLLRGRLLTVLRGVPDNNGYEALRQLVMQCQPTSRNRSLGILNALMSWKEFDMKGALLSQIVRLEDAFREYDKISMQPLASEVRFAILLRCISGQLRMHINVSLKEDASYDALREMVLQYDRANIRWTEAMSLGTSRASHDDGGAAPMDIDRVKGAKGKDKGKKGKSKTKDFKGGKGKAGFGKYDGGKSKGKDRGKNKDSGKYGKQGTQQGRGKGPLPADVCKLCGGRGHWSRECPVRNLRQVAQTQDGGSTVATQSMVSGSSGAQAVQGSPQSTTVRRIIQVDLDELNEEEEPIPELYIRVVRAGETHDLTYSDSDDDWCLCSGYGAGNSAYFMDYANNAMTVAVENMEANGSRPMVDGGTFIRGVTVGNNTSIVLDSGADMSVLPLSYQKVGKPLSKTSVLRDAQGNRMAGGNLRQAVVELEDDLGNRVCIKETFALSNVMEPLLALGKMLKKGWRVGGQHGEVHLSYGDFDKVVQSRNNSLMTQASIRMVMLDEDEKGAMVRAVTMSFEGLMRDLMTVPGWHLSMDRRVPFLVVPNTKNFKDCYPQFNRNDFPFRSTVILKGHIWEVVEVAEDKLDEGEIPECEGTETTVVCFFHQAMEDFNAAMEDFNAVGIIHTGDDDPFLQPLLRERQKGGEQQREQQGFGWFGRSLEDGVYEVEDDESVGGQMEAVDDDPLQRPHPVVMEGEQMEEIEIEGVKYTPQTSLRKLREGLKLCGLPKGRSKEQAWKRLSEHHRHFAENLGAELARREFERRKIAEGGDGVRPQSIPRLPTKAERQVHELTHWPYEDWCMQCVAARGKADPHRRQSDDQLRQEGKSEFPVISFDYAFTRGLEEPPELDKEDLRLYGGDVRGPCHQL
eukprot:s850_g4.t1